jgi:hypothetical protein
MTIEISSPVCNRHIYSCSRQAEGSIFYKQLSKMVQNYDTTDNPSIGIIIGSPNESSSIVKRNFSVTAEDGDDIVDNDSDFEEFDIGVNILEELTENGIITEEEEKRRKLFLQQYLEYQQGVDETKMLPLKLFFSTILSYLHKWWGYCMRWAYYTETD